MGASASRARRVLLVRAHRTCHRGKGAFPYHFLSEAWADSIFALSCEEEDEAGRGRPSAASAWDAHGRRIWAVLLTVRMFWSARATPSVRDPAGMGAKGVSS